MCLINPNSHQISRILKPCFDGIGVYFYVRVKIIFMICYIYHKYISGCILIMHMYVYYSYNGSKINISILKIVM
jgi:hypothetical protein